MNRSTGSLERSSGHFVVDAGGGIVEWDEGAVRLSGVPADAALGRSCNQVLGGTSGVGRTVCGPGCPAAAALEAGNLTGAAHLRVRGADGKPMRVVCELLCLPGGGALGRLRRSEQPAPDLAFELAGVAALTNRVSGEPLQQGLRDALDFLLQVTAADAGEVFLAEPHGRGLVRSCHRGSFARAFDELLHFDPGEGFPGLVLASGQPLYTDDLRQDARFLRAHVKQQGFSSYVCSPLVDRGDTVGCLALAFRRGDVDLERVLHLLHWVGTPMGLVVDAALARLGGLASRSLHELGDDPRQRLPRALRALLQQMVRMSRADSGALYLPWPGFEQHVAVPAAASLPPCPALSVRTIAQCPSYARGLTTLLHGRRDAWPSACRNAAHPGGAWCCVPMSSDGASLGLVRLRYRRLRPSPPNEHIALLEGLATLAAEKLRELRAQLRAQADTSAAPDPRRPAARAAAAAAPGSLTDGAGLAADAAADPAAELVAADGAYAAPGPAAGAAAGHVAGAQLEIRCFGRLELRVAGAAVAPAAIRRKRVLALLGILLTHRDQPQCKDALIEMLWPGADPQVRGGQFHVLVHELRRLLDPGACARAHGYVRTRGDRYAFEPQAGCWIDTVEFGALLERGRRAEATHAPQAAIDAYQAAAGLYRGDYLEDEPFAEWCWPTRERLREACLGALHRLATLWGGLGRWDRSVLWSRQAVLLDPLREELHRALMYALWAAGRRDEAVRQYQACAHLLRERLDLTPVPETEQLFARIRAAARPDRGH